jgi:hypothetical protein
MRGTSKTAPRKAQAKELEMSNKSETVWYVSNRYNAQAACEHAVELFVTKDGALGAIRSCITPIRSSTIRANLRFRIPSFFTHSASSGTPMRARETALRVFLLQRPKANSARIDEPAYSRDQTIAEAPIESRSL